jgi:hypothetical protein
MMKDALFVRFRYPCQMNCKRVMLMTSPTPMMKQTMGSMVMALVDENKNLLGRIGFDG